MLPGVIVKGARAQAVPARGRWTRRYAVGEDLTTLAKCWRIVTDVPNPQCRAIASTDRSVVSSSSWARCTRCRSSHWTGVVPVCSLNRRLSVRGLIPECDAMSVEPRTEQLAPLFLQRVCGAEQLERHRQVEAVDPVEGEHGHPVHDENLSKTGILAAGTARPPLR
jgi:hypothetical protein